MFSNKSAPETPSASSQNASPDYIGLVRFLIEPFLESPTSLKVDCENPMPMSGYGFGWRSTGQIRDACLVGEAATFKRFGQSFNQPLRRQVNLSIWIFTKTRMKVPGERVPQVVNRLQKEVHLTAHQRLNPLLDLALNQKVEG
jgi:hypothetical protein